MSDDDWQNGTRFCDPYVMLEQFDHLREEARAWARRFGIGHDHQPRNRTSLYLLSGLAVCGVCQEHGEDVSLAGWKDVRRDHTTAYRCGRKQRVRGSACTLRSVPCWLLEQAIIECVCQTIFTSEYIVAEVKRTNELLAQQGGQYARTLRQTEAMESSARKSLERLGQFVASHGSNPIIEEQYQRADREWRLASAALTDARSKTKDARPVQVTVAEAEVYAANLLQHMYEGDVTLRRNFLGSIVKRIVVYDDKGTIELVEQPALAALRDGLGEENGTKQGTPKRSRRVDIPLAGTPNGIRTRDLHLERVLS